MEAVELTETPTLARRRLSQAYTSGADGGGKRRGSFVTLEHPSIRVLADSPDQEPSLIDAPEDNNNEENVGSSSSKQRGQNKRISIVARRASTVSRVLALSSTSQSFQDELYHPTIINAMIFLDEPNPNIEKLRQTLADRLLDIPRFRCVVKDDGKNGILFEPLARSDVKVKEHIEHIDGNGTFALDDITELINNAYLSTWDIDMPLWRIKIVSNLKDGRSMLFVSIDHAIGDGVGLLSVFLSLFDDSVEKGYSSDTTKPVLQKMRKQPQGLELSHRILAILKGVWSGITEPIVPPKTDPPSSLLIPKDKLKIPCPGKDFAQTRAFPLDEINDIRSKLDGVTVNDVIMTVITMTVRRYLEQKGDTKALDLVKRGRSRIRACFPVNMRGGAGKVSKANLGNNFCLGFFPFPIGYTDPVDCVWRAKTLVDELKISPAFTLNQTLSNFIFPKVPDTILAPMMTEIANRSTCWISNVIGPSGGASLGGFSINDLNFTVAYPSSLYFGVLTFGGKLRISGILDRKVDGNLVELMKCCEESYDELKAAVENVDKSEPLKRPDMTPPSAKILVLLLGALAVVLPVYIAWKFA